MLLKWRMTYRMKSIILNLNGRVLYYPFAHGNSFMLTTVIRTVYDYIRKETQMSLIKRVAQLHIQAHSFERVIYSPKPITTFRDVGQERSFSEYAKPEGLWYACGKDWKRFVQAEMNESRAESYRYKYLLDVNLSRMCVIRTEEEMESFHFKYRDRYTRGIDWFEVSRDYDGVEICPYQQKFRMSYSWYYPWDVASGCIWGRRAFKGVTEVENDIDDGKYRD